MERKKLNDLEEYVILRKGTELPFSGRYWNERRKGVYLCQQCGAPLYRSDDKFDAGCGWPSFDAEIPGAVCRVPDADGSRTEIVCSSCGGHLGHVFTGEGLTPRNERHCVNSVSMEFVPDEAEQKDVGYGTAYFAGGCFWGMEYYLARAVGVVAVEPGYMGGTLDNPSYEEVRSGRTGHAETVKVVFDRRETGYEALARLFFEIHDPTQIDRQGPDIGTQYRSAIFYTDPEQRDTAERLTGELTARGYDIVTRIEPAGEFWPAEEYHRRYYDRRGGSPYCHRRVSRF